MIGHLRYVLDGLIPTCALQWPGVKGWHYEAHDQIVDKLLNNYAKWSLQADSERKAQTEYQMYLQQAQRLK